MTTLIAILHVVTSLFIFGVVLLQSGKGAEMGATFGSGGSQSVFGASGGSNFMTRVTTAAAVIFMLTSLTLAYMSGHAPGSTIMSGKIVPKAISGHIVFIRVASGCQESAVVVKINRAVHAEIGSIVRLLPVGVHPLGFGCVW